MTTKSKLVMISILGGLLFLGSRGFFGSKKIISHRDTLPVRAQSICLDPGHGGIDSGALYQGLYEKDLNLRVANMVAASLRASGYRVYMTRTTDKTMTNHDRYTYCNQTRATILVSIHQNYFDDSTVDYSSALYYKPIDEALAQALAMSACESLRNDCSGVSQFDGGVMSESTMPATIVEGLFMTDDAEAAQIAAAGTSRLASEANGIVSGIETYFAASSAPEPPATPARLQ